MRMRREKREKDDTRRSERFRKKRTRETFEKVSHFQTFTFQACGLRPVNTQIIREQPGRQPRCANEAESMNINRKRLRPVNTRIMRKQPGRQPLCLGAA